MMSKDQWIAEHEAIMEDLHSGDYTLGEIGDRLRDLGFDPKEIREMLQEDMTTVIPVGYFGEEK